ncbi:MAG: GTPase Era [Candidatus Cloacimonadota bacterium]|nr:GTPase Era [Candidatus Cloacimonadota bacterium]
MFENKNFKSGFVSIIGKPNVGKSSLMNAFLEQKLSIITPKPQTTRQNILGILTEKDYQIVFIDTPGFLKPRYLLQQKMQKSILNSLKDADITIFISDITTFPTEYDNQVCELIQKLSIKKIAAINKIDLAENNSIEKAGITLKKFEFDGIYFISAKNGINISNLKNEIINFLPYHFPYYPEDDLSAQTTRFFTQEIIREKIFKYLKQELPYSSAVIIEQFSESEDKAEIFANIYVETNSQKKIIIGSEGELIKKIRKVAERDIRYLIKKKVKLHLWIKVRKNWRKKERILKEFGY